MSDERASMEVLFDVSHAGQLRLIKQSLCTNGSGFTWGGQYTQFITFCQKAQWNVCGTLFLCMSLSMEFLIANVATRSLLMSFVKDNYRVGEMDGEGMKSWLCAIWVCCIMTPASHSNLHLTFASWPNIQASLSSSVTCRKICSCFLMDAYVPSTTWGKLEHGTK